jgi:hypothetical protein
MSTAVQSSRYCTTHWYFNKHCLHVCRIDFAQFSLGQLGRLHVPFFLTGLRWLVNVCDCASHLRVCCNACRAPRSSWRLAWKDTLPYMMPAPVQQWAAMHPGEHWGMSAVVQTNQYTSGIGSAGRLLWCQVSHSHHLAVSDCSLR